tara:strand:- start:1532 stop:4399 length:2868 start_codon:yes stop_codon:yes gene_type:complete
MIEENPVLPSEELVDNNTTDINVLMEDQLAEEKLPEEYDVAVNIFPKKMPKPKDDVTYKDKTHGSTINEAMEKQQEILKTKVPDNKMYTFEEGTGNVIFRNFSENEQQIIEEVMTDLQMGKLQPIEGSLQTTLRDIEGSIFDSKATLQDAVATIFKTNIEIAKRGSMSMDEIAVIASKYGRNDVYMKILKRKPGEPFETTLAYRAILETAIVRAEVDRLAGAILKDNPSQADVEAFYKTFRLYGALYSQTAGALSESGRTLGVVSKMDSPKLEGVSELENIFKDMGVDPTNMDEVKSIASAYLQLQPYQKTQFVKDSYSKKLRDAWAEAWVMTRLMSPITHTVNIVGNTSFNALRIAEYGIAAGINKLPIVGSKEGVHFNEVWAMIKSMKYGSKLAVGNAWTSLKTGDASTTKLDLRKDKAITRDLAGSLKDTPLGYFFDYMGAVVRTPGRLLVAEDEFAKGFLFQMELERLATVKMNTAIADGIDNASAEKIYLQTLADPDSETVKLVQESMLEGTFQKDLPPGILQKAQTILNVPEMKLFVPFYKTIMNIFMESNKRNPALFMFMPSVRKNLSGANGKHAQQLALAKVSTGATLMYTFGSMAYGANTSNPNMMITGMVPPRKSEREAFLRKGLQPYSICNMQDDGLFECTSYARFDPISSLLAISADFAYMSSRPDQYADPNYINMTTDLFQAGLGSIFPYITQQPFATGITEIGALFQPGYGDANDMATRALTQLMSKGTEATVGLAINPLGTFGNYLTKMSDPTYYEQMITTDQASWFRENFDGDIPAPIRAFYKAYNKAMHQSPFYNAELEPRLNLWGEEMVGPEQNMFSPIRVTKEKYNRVDDLLVELNLGIAMPRAFIGGIPLTAEEYHTIIRYTNEDYGDGNMLDEMLELMDEEEFDELLPGDKLEGLRTIVSARTLIAKQRFLEENENFNDKVELLKSKINLKGKK